MQPTNLLDSPKMRCDPGTPSRKKSSQNVSTNGNYVFLPNLNDLSILPLFPSYPRIAWLDRRSPRANQVEQRDSIEVRIPCFRQRSFSQDSRKSWPSLLRFPSRVTVIRTLLPDESLLSTRSLAPTHTRHHGALSRTTSCVHQDR